MPIEALGPEPCSCEGSNLSYSRRGHDDPDCFSDSLKMTKLTEDINTPVAKWHSDCM